ncbi:MAG: HAMP domain-containing histidine kinase [Acidobacteria bacterium]|nr:HAMP domain-containing histidine kinase [Acidobacteriota bacterium]MBP8274020.1 HAMP domain-containing histidine kinase [Acidobacteriota bacterium]
MTPLSVRAQLIVGTATILFLVTFGWTYSARQTYLEQVRILGQQMPVVARTVADALTPGEDPPERYRRVLDGLQVTPDSAAIVEDGDGRVIAASGPPAATSGRSLRSMSRLSTLVDPDGVERVWGVERRKDGKVAVAIARPVRIARERTIPIYRRNSAIALVASVLIVGVLWVTVGWSSRGMARLEHMARRVSSGDLSEPPTSTMPSRELYQLQSTMVQMIARVRELQKQVVRQERLAAIGVLVSGVAHEISNPLQAILGHTQIVQSHPDLPMGVRADMVVIQQESSRAGAIIRNLTRFTRQQPVGPAPVRLSEIVDWLDDLWRRRLEQDNIVLVVRHRSTLVVEAVATELQQVALNFLVNAEYAVTRSGLPERRIVVSTSDIDEHAVRFEVEDSGPGVASADEAHLFQPFFTTKPVGEGTGLGLSVSYGIIQSHNGRIGYDRGTMGGARFYFEVPASRESQPS